MATLKENDDPDKTDHFDKLAPAHYDPEDDPNQKEMEEEEDVIDNEEYDQEEKTLDQLICAEASNMSAIQKVCLKFSHTFISLNLLFCSFVLFVQKSPLLHNGDPVFVNCLVNYIRMSAPLMVNLALQSLWWSKTSQLVGTIHMQ